MKTYDPKRVQVTFKGMTVQGFSVESFDVETHLVEPGVHKPLSMSLGGSVCITLVSSSHWYVTADGEVCAIMWPGWNERAVGLGWNE